MATTLIKGKFREVIKRISVQIPISDTVLCTLNIFYLPLLSKFMPEVPHVLHYMVIEPTKYDRY